MVLWRALGFCTCLHGLFWRGHAQSPVLNPIDNSDDLKILHWIHIPKAGGTAFTKLLKKVVCAINPLVRDFSPCCRLGLCLHSSSCHAAVGSCPLVSAIGRHSSNMALATSVPCCTTDLAMGITASFLHFSFPKKETLTADEYGRASVGIWPLGDRAAFLLSTGVSRATLTKHLEVKKYPPELLQPYGGTAQGIIAAALPRVTSTFESDPKIRNARVSLCSVLTRVYNHREVGAAEALPPACRRMRFHAIANATAPQGRALPGKASPGSKAGGGGLFLMGPGVALGGSQAKARPVLGHPRELKVGDYSLTILRHPFARAISANLYKGHSPNYDVFDLRPGLWLHPSVKPKGYRNFNFFDYVVAPEYQNNLVKMFGYSRGCDQAKKCDEAAALEDLAGKGPNSAKHRAAEARKLGGHKSGGARRTTACTLANQCQGYRNASGLDGRHLATAKRILGRFRFLGLQEAYNASVLLLAHEFKVDLDPADFDMERSSGKEEALLCRGFRRRQVASDARVCRHVMRANHLDSNLYEFVHREFCRRLEAAGLMGHPQVARELEAGALCSSLDFGDPEQFCAHFHESAGALAFRERDAQRCKLQVPSFHTFRGDRQKPNFDNLEWPPLPQGAFQDTHTNFGLA
mmetsp:Transcript_11369/g.26708  ORF Transcript_11369/g.26708 Transcript_11369/m.26708 type:complete len:635 (+) Transcript_11369:210-2114(+)|eukprot:CAMPEP_0172583704 /NCGR_PEP_ID=MMETSP1068-20121228/3276_1 /TAXON_ID=35684 /ORGANISM="Pseudopedinella elastica, Strain CCMP716" /LENGTH=634 /DNA_ID=CAMNT_0013377589 /DNA_START=133 /DNA_END=2037 /DNA_ORIENTATION=-